MCLSIFMEKNRKCQISKKYLPQKESKYFDNNIEIYRN